MDAIQQTFLLYAQLFDINAKFMLDGLILLSRLIDLINSTRYRILFSPHHYVPPHLVQETCGHILYLKVWDETLPSPILHMAFRTLILRQTSWIYIGQTVNWRQREQRLQRYLRIMGPPLLHICLRHSVLNQYQVDALEVALIAWGYLTFGVHLLNKSPYGNFWYWRVNPNISVDAMSPQHYDRRTDWDAWRYTTLVGTAPPQGVFGSDFYQGLLRTWDNPLMDFTLPELGGTGGIIEWLASLLQEEQPPFINHYPGMSSMSNRTWASAVGIEVRQVADHAVRATLVRNGTPLAVMLGYRPTRMPAATMDQYLLNVSGTLTGSYVNEEKAVLLLWLPDPGVHWRAMWGRTTVERLFHLATIAINVIEATLTKLEVGTQERLAQLGQEAQQREQASIVNGLNRAQVHAITTWWAGHPLARKLRELSGQLSVEWSNSRRRQTQIEPPMNESLFDAFEGRQLNISELVDTEQVDDSVFVANEVASDMINNRRHFVDPRFDTLVRRRCQERNPMFDLLPISSRQEIMARECLRYGREFHLAIMNKRSREGRFQRNYRETEEVDALRCLREMYKERRQASADEFATLCTCTRCGELMQKTLQRDGRQFVLSSGGCDCDREEGTVGRAKKMTIGWHFVIGDFHNDFPGGNLFQLMANTIFDTAIIILNSRQVMHLLVTTIMANPENAQSVQMQQDYGCAFEAMLTFHVQSDSVASTAQKAVARGLERAFGHIFTQYGGCKVTRRRYRAIEVEALQGRRDSVMTLFAFGVTDRWPEELIKKFEDVGRYGYRDTLQQRTGLSME